MDDLMCEMAKWIENANGIADAIGLILVVRRLVRWLRLKWF